MAVTDMTESLPWWARQGGQPQSGAATPPGARGMTSWLDYLASMFNTSAQAGEPDITALLNRGGTPPVPNNAIVPPTGPAPPGYLGSTGATPPLAPGGDPRGPDVAMNAITGMSGGATNPGYQPPGITPGRINPNAPAPAAQPVSAAAPAAVAPVPGPMANSNRFIGIDRPNADPTNARGGAPLGTALNLAGLFGGQPTANAQPVSGPLANGGMSKAPWGMGPLQKGMQWPSAMGPFKPKNGDVARARILAPDLYG